MKDFAKELIVNESGKVSKTKLGIWLEVVLSILKIKGIIDAQTFQSLSYLAAGILGVGVRDIFKKK